MLDHKASFCKFKKTEIILSIISDHNTLRLEINYKKKKLQKHKLMEAKQYATKQNLKIKEEKIKKEIKKYQEINGNEKIRIQNSMGSRKGSTKRGL